MLVLIFILITASIFLIGSGLFIQVQTFLRLREEADPDKKQPAPFSLQGEALNRALKPFAFVINPVYKRLTYLNKLKRQAEILRIEINLFVLVGMKIFLSILFGALGFIFLRRISPLYVLFSVFFGFFLLDYVMWGKIKKKKEAIVMCFPETVDLLHMCISAGADLISTIRLVI